MLQDDDLKYSPIAAFESELFGHERGAFAGCVGRRRGMMDQTDGGTLYRKLVKYQLNN